MSIICDLVHKNTYGIQREIHGIQEVSGSIPLISSKSSAIN
jgi:hypothetical protein